MRKMKNHPPAAAGTLFTKEGKERAWPRRAGCFALALVMALLPTTIKPPCKERLYYKGKQAERPTFRIS